MKTQSTFWFWGIGGSCLFCWEDHVAGLMPEPKSVFPGARYYLREIGDIGDTIIVALTCKRHLNHVLSSREYALIDRLVDTQREVS